MKFRTEVQLSSSPFRLAPTSRVLMLGSCFAEEVGARLSDSLPEGSVVVNPCGVLYNPESIAQTLALLMADDADRRRDVEASLFEANDGRWHSWLFSTKYSASTCQACLDLCMASLQGGLQAYDLLVLTLGTDRCYRLRQDGRVVANCHKEPAARFDEVAVADSTALQDALTAISLRYPSMHVLLTVSPYRYAKYGFHESQLSKSRLLLLADALCQSLPMADYFPAYEIVLDELRDYRFYASDMLHPSEQAADYIFERFRDWCFTPELVTFAAARLKALKQSRHRPIGG